MTDSTSQTPAELSLPNGEDTSLSEKVPIEDWTILSGVDVEIRRNGTTVRRGRVEETTRDGLVLWLDQTHNEPRQLFEKESGHEAWVSQASTALMYHNGGRNRWT